MKLVLASTSPSRRAMLAAAGVGFEAVSPGVDERVVQDALGDIAPATLAATLAQKKALSVEAESGTLVLSCDSVLETADGEMLCKPQTPELLHAQLEALRGREHRLISAAAIAEGGDIVWRDTETAAMQMRALSDRFIAEYVAREWGEARHCVGGYRIEAGGIQLFDRIEGSHFAILGLPLLPLLGYLRGRGLVAA